LGGLTKRIKSILFPERGEALGVVGEAEDLEPLDAQREIIKLYASMRGYRLVGYLNASKADELAREAERRGVKAVLVYSNSLLPPREALKLRELGLEVVYVRGEFMRPGVKPGGC